MDHRTLRAESVSQTALVALLALLCFWGNIVAQKKSQVSDVIGTTTGNSIMINDSLLYEAPSYYPNTAISKEAASSWQYFREAIMRQPVTVVQSAEGVFIDVIAVDKNYINELKNKINKIKLLPGKLNGKPCASIGIDAKIEITNWVNEIDLPFTHTFWYPILPVDSVAK